MISFLSCRLIRKLRGMSWPVSRCYPSQVWRFIQANGRFFVTARKFSSQQKSMKSCYYLWLIRGRCLHTVRFMRRFGEIARLVVKTTPSAFTSVTYGRSYIRQLPMLPLPSDPSGKSDTVLKYKQKNKSQQSDPLRLLFFFSAVNLSYSGKFTFSCHHARCHLSPKGRSCPLAEGGIFVWSRFPDLKKQAALAAPGTVPLLSDEKLRLF